MANPEKLYGIFGDAQWTNKDRLSDDTLKDLIEHFFNARRCPSPTCRKMNSATAMST